MKLAALMLMAALNPLVVRSPEPHGNVPANCETSDLPPMPRIAVADAGGQESTDTSTPLPPVKPKSTGTATTTRYDAGPLQAAIARNDRAAFDAELARAREAGHPTRVFEDVGRLWDAQFESPYFAEGSDPHRIASQYTGYEAAVREQVFTDASGRKFYPAAESRNFVARQTGVRAPASTSTRSTTQQQQSARQPSAGTTGTTAQRSTEPTAQRSSGQADNRTTRQPSSTQTTQRTTQQRSAGQASSTRSTSQPSNRATEQPSNPATTPQTTKSSPPVARGSTSPSRSPDPSATQKRVATEPAPVVSQVGDTSSTETPSAAGSFPSDIAVTETTAADTAVVDTMATDTAMPASETATDAPATTTAPTNGAEPKRATRSIVLPAILILLGLGVLILLFKAR